MKEIANLRAAHGVFHHLISYIMRAIYARRLNHMTMHHPDSDDLLMEVPIEEDSSILAKELNLSPSRTNWDSEIIIEFRHDDEKSENWINAVCVQNQSESVRDGVKRVNDTWDEKKGNDRFEVKLETGIQSDHKVSKKKVCFKDVGGEKKIKGKEKSDQTNQTTPFKIGEKTKMPMSPPRAIASVISNINEKSEEFIRSRKAAMRRNFNLELENQ